MSSGVAGTANGSDWFGFETEATHSVESAESK